ncbi:MAG: NADH-quinone oxidoreductase subunit A [Bdellovibrio sp.]|nr:NADH-quinone oxidoreductase subunit A [Bdellovibrio sp.]
MQSISQDFLAYAAVFVVIVISLVVACALLILNKILGQRPSEVTVKKGEPYECGVKRVGDARQQFSVRYYLVGIVFLLFDVEVIFMYPWAVVYNKYLSQGAFIMMEMALFVAILLGGYIYLRRRHALDWD